MSDVGQIDPNVRIPAAVRQAAARADLMFKAANIDPNAPPPEVTPEVTEPLPAEAGSDQKKAPAPTPPPAPPAPAGEDEGSWEHRYKSMKGRLDRQTQINQDLSDRLASMQNVIATLQARPATPTPPELRAERLITPQEEQDYGTDFLSVVGKRAREEMAGEIESLRKQLTGFAGSVQMNAREQLYATLDTRCPQWRELNVNEAFNMWLQLPDAYSGAIRHQLLMAAFESNDASRTLAFFNGFLADEAAVDPAKAQPDLTTPEGLGKVTLASLAAPGRAKTAAASTPAEKPYIKRADITAFYADVAAGKYRGREDEKDKLEKMIFSAQAEGRIT